MYTKVSIPKNGDGAGCPVSRSSNIIIIDVDDIKVEPTREVGNTALKGDLELVEGAKAVAIYATPTTITPCSQGFALVTGVMKFPNVNPTSTG